jgi:hypothetical protein
MEEAWKDSGKAQEQMQMKMMEQEEEVTTLHDLLVGRIAGTYSVIVVGHPFDTIKVQLQTSALSSSSLSSGVATQHFGGFSSL